MIFVILTEAEFLSLVKENRKRASIGVIHRANTTPPRPAVSLSETPETTPPVLLRVKTRQAKPYSQSITSPISLSKCTLSRSLCLCL